MISLVVTSILHLESSRIYITLSSGYSGSIGMKAPPLFKAPSLIT